MRYLILAVLFLAGCASLDLGAIVSEKNKVSFNKYGPEEHLPPEIRNALKLELKQNYYDTIGPSPSYDRFIDGLFADESSLEYLSDTEIEELQKVIQQEVQIAQLRYENKRLRRQRAVAAIGQGLEDFGRGYQGGSSSYHGSAQSFRDMTSETRQRQILNEQRRQHQQLQFQRQQQQLQQQMRQQQQPHRPFGWRYRHLE